jgi:hypothetical protein
VRPAFLRRRKSQKTPPVSIASDAVARERRCGSGPSGQPSEEDCAAVAIVSVVVAAVPEGVTFDGLKLHVAPVGKPVQAKLICWLKPPAGVTVMVVCADCPAVTVALAGESAIVKLGVTAWTVTVTAVEVEPEKFVSPP